MPSGGARLGAGRKPGSTNRISAEARANAAATGEMPVDYMLRIMRDENVDARRRDDMAKSVAPYLHPKLSSVQQSGEDKGPLIVILDERDAEI